MLGENIAKLRKQSGLSQYTLAERLGFSRGKLANYEQGSREPDYETLQKIANYFEVTTDYLLSRNDNTKKGIFDNEEEELEKWMNDPETDIFFREYINSPDDMKEQLRKIWDIIKKDNTSKF